MSTSEPGATPAAEPGAMARPASTGELAHLVREARSSGAALRIAGAGSWLDAGRPVRAGRIVSVRSISGVTEYVPGDLTITAMAGTPLAELETVTAAEGQFIPLDPFGSAESTVGATIATGSSGPLGEAFGLPRDVVLGLEAVLGQGDVVQGGGRVVKNVAGFDLVRLLTGAWGTLGIITTVTLRLRALSEVDLTVAIPAPDERQALQSLLERLAALPVAPTACELVDAGIASRLASHDSSLLLVRLMGSETSVRAQRRALSALGDVSDTDRDVWSALRASDPPGAATIRWSSRRTTLPRLWQAARTAGERLPAAGTHASVLRGIVRQVAPGASTEALREAWCSFRESVGGEDVAVLAERLPAELWPLLAPSGANDRLSRGVRLAFDPDHLLNPGIFGESLPSPEAIDSAATAVHHA